VSADWFARRLKELREASGMTQSQLADKAGLKVGGVRDLEQGRRRPTWETVLALAGALDVAVLTFAQPPEEQPEPKRGRPTKDKPEGKGRKKS
jgi:transcriptional regulator with XRE-family HTH domain